MVYQVPGSIRQSAPPSETSTDQLHSLPAANGNTVEVLNVLRQLRPLPEINRTESHEKAVEELEALGSHIEALGNKNATLEVSNASLHERVNEANRLFEQAKTERMALYMQLQKKTAECQDAVEQIDMAAVSLQAAKEHYKSQLAAREEDYRKAKQCDRAPAVLGSAMSGTNIIAVAKPTQQAGKPSANVSADDADALRSGTGSRKRSRTIQEGTCWSAIPRSYTLVISDGRDVTGSPSPGHERLAKQVLNSAEASKILAPESACGR
ncbi:hypothetical protein QFC24_004045 [Naganishia onofrii]|uniref:Uncharacterized protein n=1 Tax=Naganishia onofrii TaxID=1851511 RepID=A0ACC2XH93_9TREE|nr:hypothetical protein QFC24_004045 [Naganishia onofrii]